MSSLQRDIEHVLSRGQFGPNGRVHPNDQNSLQMWARYPAPIVRTHIVLVEPGRAPQALIGIRGDGGDWFRRALLHVGPSGGRANIIDRTCDKRMSLSQGLLTQQLRDRAALLAQPIVVAPCTPDARWRQRVGH